MKKLNSLISEIPYNKINYWIVICVLTMFFSLNILLKPLLNFQIDVTDAKINTISNETKTILQEIPFPITIKVFYSPSLGAKDPIYANFYQQVIETLTRYNKYVPEKIKLEIHPISDLSETEKIAIDYGLTGVPITKEVMGYFGIVMVDSMENEKIIPFINPYIFTNIEYDLSKLILSMFNLNPPIIGIMSDFPVMGQLNYDYLKGRSKTKAWDFIDILQDFYKLIEVPPSSLIIPQEIQVMFVMNPASLNEHTAYALEQYLLRGGKMILLLDNYSRIAIEYKFLPRLKNKYLYNMLSTLGISLDNKNLITDLSTAHDVVVNKKQGKLITSDILWMDLDKKSFADTNDLLNSISKLSFYTASPLKIETDKGLKVIELIKSSDKAMLLDTDKVEENISPEKLKNEYKPGTEAFLIGARLYGKFNSGYKEKPKSNFPQLKNQLPHAEKSISPTDIVVISDSDFIFDYFWNIQISNNKTSTYKTFADNANFIINIIDEMTGQLALKDLRNRSSHTNSLSKLTEYKKNITTDYSIVNANLFEQAETAEKTITAIEAAANNANKSLSIDEIQQIQVLKQLEKEVTFALKQSNFAMQKEIDSLISFIININLFAIPGLITLIVIISFFRKKKNVS